MYNFFFFQYLLCNDKDLDLRPETSRLGLRVLLLDFNGKRFTGDKLFLRFLIGLRERVRLRRLGVIDRLRRNGDLKIHNIKHKKH